MGDPLSAKRALQHVDELCCLQPTTRSVGQTLELFDPYTLKLLFDGRKPERRQGLDLSVAEVELATLHDGISAVI